MDLNTVTEFAPATVIDGAGDGEAAWRDGDAWLAGGSWLFSEPQPRLRRLLDLNAFGWPPLTETDDGLTIAATATLAQLARWRPARARYGRAAGLARQCCDALLGSFKVHNVATVGGNICLALPAGPMTSLAAALDGVATLAAAGGGIRRVAVADFVTGDGRTRLRPGELLTRIDLPAAALTARTAFHQLSLAPMGRSAVLVIARRDTARRDTALNNTAGHNTAGRSPDGAVTVTVTASLARPLLLRFPALPDPAAAVAALDRAAPDYLDDVHGAGPWRAAMTRRAVADVVARVSEGAETEPRR